MSMRALLSYNFITLRESNFKNISFSDVLILKTKNFISIFFFHFSNLRPVLNILKKKIILIAIAFPKIQTVKDFVRPHSKKRRVRTPFESQHVKGSQTLVKFVWEYFYQILLTLWGKLIWKTSPLVTCEILGVFVNTLTADDKYRVLDCGNLLLPIQSQLS